MKTFNIRSLTVREYILIASVVALLFMLIKGCNNTPAPVLTPTKVLRDTVRIIEQDRKHLTDSFNAVLKKQYADNYKNESDFIELANQNAELSVINERLQNELVVPDTCKGIVKKYQDAYGNYEAQTNKTIEQGKRSIAGLSETVKTQKKFLDTKDAIYERLKRATDTCLANSAAMEKYINKSKPKRSINLNVQTISPYIGKIKPEFGAGIGYENKKGLEISATYWTNQQISIRISKPLFRF